VPHFFPLRHLKLHISIQPRHSRLKPLEPGHQQHLPKDPLNIQRPKIPKTKENLPIPIKNINAQTNSGKVQKRQYVHCHVQ
jgi:hypothetical protein